ncbi:hypothetical protein HZH66_014861 [Vespula vulgaris]|uniref:Uncharacterized protein n=1 Tax=Vespula vulgaris TaxID=7454 RepID=A0A834MNS5_VESVU|nr:hypothetical protein HZH66_014861 [Vespula vulgaris]
MRSDPERSVGDVGQSKQSADLADEINAEKSLCIFLEKTEQEGIVERRGGEGKGGGGGGGGGEGVVERGGTRDRSTNDKPIVPGGENLEIHSVV